MADLKMPEINYVIVAGNLTKDPIFRQTTNNTPVVNFSIASNRKYKDSSNQWQEDVCYVGIVAWNKLAESCRDRLKKGSAVLLMANYKAEAGNPKKGIIEALLKLKQEEFSFLIKDLEHNYNGVMTMQVDAFADEVKTLIIRKIHLINFYLMKNQI